MKNQQLVRRLLNNSEELGGAAKVLRYRWWMNTHKNYVIVVTRGSSYVRLSPMGLKAMKGKGGEQYKLGGSSIELL